MRSPRDYVERKASGTRRSRRAIAEGRAAGTRSPSEGQAASGPWVFPSPSSFLGSFSCSSTELSSVRAGRIRGLHSLSLAQPWSGYCSPIPAPAEEAQRAAASAASDVPYGPTACASGGDRGYVHPGGGRGVLVRVRPLHHREDPSRGSGGGVSGDRGPHGGAKRTDGRAVWRTGAQGSETQNGRSRTPGSCRTRRRTEGVYSYRSAPPNVIC